MFTADVVFSGYVCVGWKSIGTEINTSCGLGFNGVDGIADVFLQEQLAVCDFPHS